MSAEQLLARASSILAGGANWTKYQNACDSSGKECPILSSRAVKWDIYGAIYKAHAMSGVKHWRFFQEAYDLARSRIPKDWTEFRRGNEDLEHWNDYGDFATASVVLGGGTGTPLPPPPKPTVTVEVLGTGESGGLITDSTNVLIKV